MIVAKHVRLQSGHTRAAPFICRYLPAAYTPLPVRSQSRTVQRTYPGAFLSTLNRTLQRIQRLLPASEPGNPLGGQLDASVAEAGAGLNVGVLHPLVERVNKDHVWCGCRHFFPGLRVVGTMVAVGVLVSTLVGVLDGITVSEAVG